MITKDFQILLYIVMGFLIWGIVGNIIYILTTKSISSIYTKIKKQIKNNRKIFFNDDLSAFEKDIIEKKIIKDTKILMICSNILEKEEDLFYLIIPLWPFFIFWLIIFHIKNFIKNTIKA